MGFTKEQMAAGGAKGKRGKTNITVSRADLVKAISVNKIFRELKTLDGKEYLDAVVKFLPYVMPRLANIEIQGDIEIKKAVIVKVLPSETNIEANISE